MPANITERPTAADEARVAGKPTAAPTIPRYLLDCDVRGEDTPPGGNLGIVVSEPDGTRLLVDGRGEEVGFWLVPAPGVSAHPLLVPISTANALRVAWFVLWRLWVRGLWCGLRLALYRRALRRVAESAVPR
jgi:hypothetical protein